MILDFLLRRGNPTNPWSRSSNLTLTAELLTPAINRIPLGAEIGRLSFLGRSTANETSPLDFADLGLSIDNEADGSVSGFQLVFADWENVFSPFSGTMTLNHCAVSLEKLPGELGEPYWVDHDDDESILFFEFPNHEIQIGQSHDGRAKRVVVTTYPLMSDEEQRKAYGVDKAWPPGQIA